MKPKKLIRKLIKLRNFRKLNTVLFYNDWLPLKQTPTDLNLTIHERTEKMDKLIITNVVDKHAREKVMRIGNNNTQKTDSTNKFSDTQTDNQIKHYKKFRNYVTNQIRTAK